MRCSLLFPYGFTVRKEKLFLFALEPQGINQSAIGIEAILHVLHKGFTLAKQQRMGKVFHYGVEFRFLGHFFEGFFQVINHRIGGSLGHTNATDSAYR